MVGAKVDDADPWRSCKPENDDDLKLRAAEAVQQVNEIMMTAGEGTGKSSESMSPKVGKKYADLEFFFFLLSLSPFSPYFTCTDVFAGITSHHLTARAVLRHYNSLIPEDKRVDDKFDLGNAEAAKVELTLERDEEGNVSITSVDEIKPHWKGPNKRVNEGDIDALE